MFREIAKSGLLMIVGVGCLNIALLPAYGEEIARDGGRPADLVVMNANIVTCDDKDTRAEALAVKDECLTYVGNNKGVRDYIGPNTRVINAQGQLLVPGFIDNHCHHLWIGGLGAFFVDLYGAKSIEDVRVTITEYANAHPNHPFIMGIGWHYNYIPDGRPTKEMADAILPDRPLFLMSFDGDAGWVNSITMERMQTKNPKALSRFQPDTDPANGKPTGLLHEFYAVNPLEFFTEEELGADTKQLMFDAMARTLDQARAYGITAINDVQLYEPFLPWLLEFHEQGGLAQIRARGSYYISHYNVDEKVLAEELQRWKELGARRSDSHLHLGDSVKLYIDGVAGNHSSYQFEPFSDKPDSNGRVLWTQEGINSVVTLADSLGMQCCTHSCGDAGINTMINAYEHAGKVNGVRDSRHRVEHCSNPLPTDCQRMSELGIHAAMQPCHFYGDPMVEAALGPERLKRFMPWHSLEDAGVTVSFGSDWCAGPMNPVLGFLVAGLRLNYLGNSKWGKHEKITTRSILQHYTLDSAKALMWDKEIGSLEVGKYGDFAIYSENLLKVTSWWFLLTHDLKPEKLEDFVFLTVVGGDVVYHRLGVKF